MPDWEDSDIVKLELQIQKIHETVQNNSPIPLLQHLFTKKEHTYFPLMYFYNYLTKKFK